MLLLSRDRIHQIIAENQRFRPAEELHRRRHHSSANPPSNATLARLASQPSPLRRDSIEPAITTPMTPAPGDAPPSFAPPTPAVFVPVGGRARVFQAPDLARAKRSLQRRRHALAAVKRSTTADALAAQSASGKQALIAELVRSTAFTTQHIFHMSRKFKEIAGTSKSVITFAEFRQLLSDDVTSLLVASGDRLAEQQQTITIDSSSGANTTDVDMRSISATIAASDSFLRRLFQMFDGDGDGKIDFREFVVGLNAFAKGSIEDKVDALFAVYQRGTVDQPAVDEKGEEQEGNDTAMQEPTVAISDLLGLFQGDRQLYQELMRSVDEYFARAPSVASPTGGEEEEASTIADDDFVAASLAEPTLLESISRPTSSLVYSEDAILREQLKAFVDRRGVRWSKMLALLRCAIGWHIANATATVGIATVSSTAATPTTAASAATRAPRSSSSDLLVPIVSALPILSDCLDGGASSEEDHEELNRLLRWYIAKSSTAITDRPPTSSAQLNLLAFLQDLTVVLLHPTSTSSASSTVEPTEADAKARYYFELFDLDGDGLLSRHELVSAVCAGFAHFGPHLTEVVRVLEAEDGDMDGQLTKDQYLRAARRSSLILASLYTCL